MRRFIALALTLVTLCGGLAHAAVGDLVATLSIPGMSGSATYTLTNNPGGYFAIQNGNQLVEAIPTPAGQYSIVIQGTEPGASPRTQPFFINYSPSGPPPYIPGFAVGLNLSGLESEFPLPTSNTEIAYDAARGFTRYRLPTGWSQSNPQCTTVGFQPTTFGALDTTNTCIGTGGYVGLVDAEIAAIAANGGSALLDIHTFGNGPGGYPIGSTQVPCTAFADLWGKLSVHYKGMAGVGGYGVMNEPVNGFSSATLQTCYQLAINAIRANNDTTPIYIDGTNYSGAWNWVSGQGQPYSSANLYQLSDPLNRLVFEPHSYLDNDSSGSNFSWALEIAKAGAAPPGTPTSSTIGVTRLTPVVSWANSHNVQISQGETGGSNDALTAGGNDNYAAWNTALGNEIAFAQTNNVPVYIWGGGANFNPTYPAYVGPSSTLNPGQPDFSSAGLQSTLMVLLEQYTGYSGPQPLAYRIDLPVTVTATSNPEAPTVTSVPYGTMGVASGNFAVRYNGKITSPVLVTPHDTLSDGTTAAGGTFTPAAVTLAAGNNAIAYFTYTPSQAATILISATNNAGWINPPVLGFSSIADPYRAFSLPPTNEYGMYRRYTPYVGNAILLQRATDNAQRAFPFNNIGNLPRATIQSWASSNLISIVAVYDQSSLGNTLTFTGTLPILNLNNAAGYPEIECGLSTTGTFSTPVTGQTAMSVIARMNQSSSAAGGLFRQDQFLGPLVWGPSNFQIFDTPGSSVVAQVSLGIVNNAYHEYGVTYASGATNGLKSYLDGSLNAQATGAAYTLNPSFGNNLTQFAYFAFGSAPWKGSFYNLEFEQGQTLNLTQLDAITTTDNTYYSTPLPDVLPSAPPTIIGTGVRSTVPGHPSTPFASVIIQDSNSGTPTDSLVITLSGNAGGTLSGTGLSGSGPYTMAAALPATITSQLQGIAYTTSAAAGDKETMTIAATSSAGPTSTDANTVVTVIAIAPAETPFPAPSGTFTPRNHSGVNISGGEQSYPATSGGCTPNCSYNYAYPQNIEMAYWAGAGFGAIRMPVQTRRMQEFSYGALDPAGRTDEPPQAYRTFSAGSQTNLLAIQQMLNYARTQGLYVIFDLHNFGTITDTLNGGLNRIIGQDAEGTAQWVDILTRLATKFQNYDNIIWDPENEPNQATAAQWFTGATAGISAIAAVTTAQPVWIEGTSFSGGHSWVSSGNAAAWAGYTPPAGLPFMINVHEYLDSDYSGTHAVCVNGSSPMAGLTSWATTNGFKVAVTETGWSQDASCPSVATDLMSYLKTNSSVYGGYTYWVGGNSLFYSPWSPSPSYIYTAVPEGYPSGPFTDAPQTGILQSNILN